MDPILSTNLTYYRTYLSNHSCNIWTVILFSVCLVVQINPQNRIQFRTGNIMVKKLYPKYMQFNYWKVIIIIIFMLLLSVLTRTFSIDLSVIFKGFKGSSNINAFNLKAAREVSNHPIPGPQHTHHQHWSTLFTRSSNQLTYILNLNIVD